MTSPQDIPVTRETMVQASGRRRYSKRIPGGSEICSWEGCTEKRLPKQSYCKPHKAEAWRTWSRNRTAELKQLRALMGDGGNDDRI